MREATMVDAHKPLGSAILSLLVAADQRCPAIIGQAHLLYYARFGTSAENATKSFAQLKKDAADLFKAIADVDAAMNETAPHGAGENQRKSAPSAIASGLD